MTIAIAEDNTTTRRELSRLLTSHGYETVLPDDFKDLAGQLAGLSADLILLDGEALNLIPCHDAANNLAYAAHGSNVVMNMARGKVIYKNGTFLTIDIERVKKEVEGYALPLLFGR